MLHAVLQRCGGHPRYSFARLETPAYLLAIPTCIERRPSSIQEIVARGVVESRRHSTSTLNRLTTCFTVLSYLRSIFSMLVAGCRDVAQGGLCDACVSLTDNLGETKLNQHFVHSA
jgi:hypothetical protein